MKTESIIIKTTKSLSEISSTIRDASSKLRAHICSSEESPFGNYEFQKSDISVVLCGSNSIFGGPRKWGVQIIIKDYIIFRNVELIAVGDSFMDKLSNGSFGNAFYEIRDSRERMNSIVSMIKY